MLESVLFPALSVSLDILIRNKGPSDCCTQGGAPQTVPLKHKYVYKLTMPPTS